MKICIVGHGYVGSRVAAACRLRNDRVTIVSRSVEAQSDAVRMHWCNVASDQRFDGDFDCVVFCVSHRREQIEGEPSNDHAIGLENVLSRFSDPPKRVIYLSTTGVYAASTYGDWVNEESPCKPDRPGSMNAYEGEQWLMSSATNSVILRPAGIYGPSRIPNLVALSKGDPIAADPESYLNLVHVDDLVRTIFALIDTPQTKHRIYNVADRNPVKRREYYEFIAETIKGPSPKFSSDPTSSIRSRSQTNKRIDSTRLHSEFKLGWQFENYKHGLIASFS
jgi:nucleoside-diphosphate-sugar epimerase